jgi:outer membrane protein assembly factor BamB
MAALSSTAPAPNHGVPLCPGPHRTWLLTALVAGLFSLVVSGVMVFDRFRIAAGDPLKSAQMTALREQLAAAPMDEQLKTQIRDLDLRLRRHYFDHLSLNNAGAWLLLAGLAVCVLSAKRGFQLRKRPHLPQARPEAAEETARLAAWARWGVGITGGVVGAGLLTLLLTASTALPSRPAELAKLLGGGESSEANPNDLPSLAELQTNWPRFRGWDGNGVATSTHVPLQWDVTSGAGVLWKTPVPAPGFNSPIVWGNRVVLSGAEAEKREVFCFDAESGQMLWQRSVQNVPGSPARLPEIPGSTGFAAATMATDGRRVYAIFGNGDVAAFTLDGAPAWARNLGVPKNAHGHASSLTLWQGRLLVQLDQGEGAGGLSRLYALDGATGREVWQRSRPVPSSWATPIVIEAAGQAQLITLGVPWVIAYAAANGNELWRAELLDGEVTPSPIFAGGFVFVVSPNLKLAALRPDGQGDVTKTHVAWFAEDNMPDITSPVGDSELVFTLSTSGLLTCYDVKDGKKQWEQDFVMECHASPTIVGNRLYAITTKGTVIVVEVARQFKALARMEMGEKISASPAIVGGRIFIRGAKHLFGIGAKEQKVAKR